MMYIPKKEDLTFSQNDENTTIALKMPNGRSVELFVLHYDEDNADEYQSSVDINIIPSEGDRDHHISLKLLHNSNFKAFVNSNHSKDKTLVFSDSDFDDIVNKCEKYEALLTLFPKLNRLVKDYK